MFESQTSPSGVVEDWEQYPDQVLQELAWGREPQWVGRGGHGPWGRASFGHVPLSPVLAPALDTMAAQEAAGSTQSRVCRWSAGGRDRSGEFA